MSSRANERSIDDAGVLRYEVPGTHYEELYFRSTSGQVLQGCAAKAEAPNGPLRSSRRYVRSHTHIAHAAHSTIAHAAGVPLMLLGQFSNHRIGREHQSSD